MKFEHLKIELTRFEGIKCMYSLNLIFLW
uniref:Uncharacterized protein n=1 Tax=Tetranychus urticae TaxID=32264 RepID=T1K473_TETUR